MEFVFSSTATAANARFDFPVLLGLAVGHSPFCIVATHCFIGFDSGAKRYEPVHEGKPERRAQSDHDGGNQPTQKSPIPIPNCPWHGPIRPGDGELRLLFQGGELRFQVGSRRPRRIADSLGIVRCQRGNGGPGGAAALVNRGMGRLSQRSTFCSEGPATAS